MAGAFYSGKYGAVSVNGVVQPLTDWSLDIKTDSLDITNFTSEGWNETLAGIFSADISASGPYDGTSAVVQGNIAVFILKVGEIATVPLSVTINALVTSVKIDTSVKDVAKISYTATSHQNHTLTP